LFRPLPGNDLAALAAQNPGIVFLDEFDKNTVLKARLREYGQTPQDAATVSAEPSVPAAPSRRASIAPQRLHESQSGFVERGIGYNVRGVSMDDSIRFLNIIL
jgi:hypothetical protein